MAALIAFYSRAGENYFGGAYRRISVGNTEKVAEMLADLTGGVFGNIVRFSLPYLLSYFLQTLYGMEIGRAHV